MMAEPFLGEIRMFSMAFPPRGWALCDGQIMSITQNEPLYSLLGNTYGGNGKTTFALPDLRGRVPVHFGKRFGVEVVLGEKAGEENHTLIQSEMPQHSHAIYASEMLSDSKTPQNNRWGTTPVSAYHTASPDVKMSLQSVANLGGSQPHNNMQPYLTVSFCIAIQGIFPTRN